MGAAALAWVLVGFPGAGCVERRLYLRTEPPGARVYMDGRLVGESPLEVPFDHYGRPEVIARFPGRRPARVRADLAPPLWQLFPLDLAAELVPWTLVDRHDLSLELGPADSMDPEALGSRAGRLREEEGSR